MLSFASIETTCYYPPSTTLKGDIETVSVRPSFRPSVCPSVRNESPLTATISHRSLPNLYSMFISLKYFIISGLGRILYKVFDIIIICSFMKQWQKLLLWQPFYFLSFNAYLSMFLTWQHEGNFLLYFDNIFIKVQRNFSVIFC